MTYYLMLLDVTIFANPQEDHRGLLADKEQEGATENWSEYP